MNPWMYLWLLLRSSLFSTGGSGNMPLIYAEFVPRGWATPADFAQALAIGQISPGPTGLWVVSFGYLTDGLRGSMMAFIAILIPPLFVVAIDSVYRRVAHLPAVEGFVRGLSLAVVGVLVVILAQLMADTALNPLSIAIAVLSLIAGATGRFPPVAVLVLAAVAGIAVF